MGTSINLHDVKEIEIKEDILFTDSNGNPTPESSFVTDIIIDSGSYGETTISLFASKKKPITIKREVEDE